MMSDLGTDIDTISSMDLNVHIANRATPGAQVKVFAVDYSEPGGDTVDPQAILDDGTILWNENGTLKASYGDLVAFRNVPASLEAYYVLQIENETATETVRIHPVNPPEPSDDTHLSWDILGQIDVQDQQSSDEPIPEFTMSTSNLLLVSHDERIVSQGAATNTGTFIKFTGIQSTGPVRVTYSYCYFANSNGRLGQISTDIDGRIVETFEFQKPFTGGGTCDHRYKETFAQRTVTLIPPDDNEVDNQIAFHYKNGDYKLVIADIRVENPEVLHYGGNIRSWGAAGAEGAFITFDNL